MNAFMGVINKSVNSGIHIFTCDSFVGWKIFLRLTVRRRANKITGTLLSARFGSVHGRYR